MDHGKKAAEQYNTLIRATLAGKKASFAVGERGTLSLLLISKQKPSTARTEVVKMKFPPPSDPKLKKEAEKPPRALGSGELEWTGQKILLKCLLPASAEPLRKHFREYFQYFGVSPVTKTIEVLQPNEWDAKEFTEEPTAAFEEELAGGENQELETEETLEERQPEDEPEVLVPSNTVAYTKVLLLWDAAKKRAAVDISRLETGILAAFANDPDLDIVKSKIGKLDTAMAAYDDRLQDKIDQAMNLPEGDRPPVYKDALTIVEEYLGYLNGDEFIQALDSNPFVPVQVHATLNSTLVRLRAALSAH